MSQFPWVYSQQNWASSFKKHTYPTTTIPLTNDFIEFLLSDGIKLPSHISSTLVTSSGTTISQVSDADNEFFPQIMEHIVASLEQYTPGVFPKVEWYSPLDALWMQPDSSMRCIIPRDILLLIHSSSNCHTFLRQYTQQVSACLPGSPAVATPSPETPDSNQTQRKISTTPALYLRKWLDSIHPSEAFRVFVHNQRIIGISQKDGVFYTKMQCPDYINDIWDEINHFHTSRFVPSWSAYLESDPCQTYIADHPSQFEVSPLEHYIYDVNVNSKTFSIRLLDIYPFSSQIPTILFGGEEFKCFESIADVLIPSSDLFMTVYTIFSQYLSQILQMQSNSPIPLKDEYYLLTASNDGSTFQHPLAPLISPYTFTNITPTLSLNLCFVPLYLLPPLPNCIAEQFTSLVNQYGVFLRQYQDAQSSQTGEEGEQPHDPAPLQPSPETFLGFLQSLQVPTEDASHPPMHPMYHFLFRCYRYRLLLASGYDNETIENALLSQYAHAKTEITDKYVNNTLYMVKDVHIPLDSVKAFRDRLCSATHLSHSLPTILPSDLQEGSEHLVYDYTSEMKLLQPSHDNPPAFPHVIPHTDGQHSSPLHTVYLPLFPPYQPLLDTINVIDLDDESLASFRIVTNFTRHQAEQTKTVHMEASRLPDEDLDTIDVSNAQGIESLVEMMKLMQAEGYSDDEDSSS